jgi:hypothetical protein
MPCLARPRPSARNRPVILRSAEAEIAGKFVEAAKIYADYPAALQLRAMNIIYETTKERGTTILIPTSMVDSMNPASALVLAGQRAPGDGVPSVLERGVERVLIDDTTSRDALISNAPGFINARQPTLSRRGTEGSNLAPSSSESDANLTRNREKGCDVSVVVVGSTRLTRAAAARVRYRQHTVRGAAAVRYAEHDPAVELDHPQRHRRARIGMGIKPAECSGGVPLPGCARSEPFRSPQDQIQWGILFLGRHLRRLSPWEREECLQDVWEWGRQRGDLLCLQIIRDYRECYKAGLEGHAHQRLRTLVAEHPGPIYPRVSLVVDAGAPHRLITGGHRARHEQVPAGSGRIAFHLDMAIQAVMDRE